MAALAIILFVVGVALVGAGIALIVGGGKSRGVTSPRVAVPASVVRQVGLRQPPILEVDYPGPDGRPLRGRVQVPMSVAGFGQSLLTRGATTTVWVDPRRPLDISLEQGGDSGTIPRFVGLVLVFLGAGALIAAAIQLFVLVLTS